VSDHGSPTRHSQAVVLAIVSASAFMGVLDVAIVNVALPSVQRDLGLSVSSLQWVVTAYSVLFGGFLLLGGRLADLLGRRRIFVAGLGLFSFSSLAAGLAPSVEVLVIARGVQGLSAALMAPSALSILTTTFAEGAERNRALGIWGAVAGSGATAGVIIGGLLTSGPGWEWIFFINVPIGFALASLALWSIPETRERTPRRGFDAAGAVSVTSALLLLVYTLNRTIDFGWGSPRTLGLLAVSAILLASFLAIEARSAAPIMPLGIFRRRNLAAANVSAVLLFGSFFPVTFMATLYMQQVLGYSALRTGLTFLPMSLSTIVTARAVGDRWIGRIGPRPILAPGLALIGFGALLLSRAPVDGSLADLVPAFILIGLGLGAAAVSVQVAAFVGVRPGEAGLASGVVTTSQQLGGAVGVALIATLAASRARDVLIEAGAGATAQARALAEGLEWGFLGAAAVAGTGAVLAIALFGRWVGATRGQVDQLEVEP
jgi:EmrB/QacA subfamily drug resistance transporter